MIEAYGCYTKNNLLRSCSSSGGVFPILAEKIIINGGIVFAARYTEHLQVEHSRLDSISEIKNYCGSKYCASNLGNTYSSVYGELELGKCVLFVGTPCQCSGLLSFLKEKNKTNTYDNLVTVDFACHGVPSPLAWERYLDSYKEKGYTVDAVNMRYKGTGWSRGNYSWKIIGNKGERWVHRWSSNPYMKGYISNIYLRPCCYNCRFKGLDRESDITLADYWGVWNLNKELDDDNGTSLILINSKKGKDIFEEICPQLVYRSIDVDSAIPYNRSIIESAKFNKKRALFFKRIYQGEEFNSVVSAITRTNCIIKGVYYILGKIKNKLHF